MPIERLLSDECASAASASAQMVLSFVWGVWWGFKCTLKQAVQLLLQAEFASRLEKITLHSSMHSIACYAHWHHHNHDARLLCNCCNAIRHACTCHHWQNLLHVNMTTLSVGNRVTLLDSLYTSWPFSCNVGRSRCSHRLRRNCSQPDIMTAAMMTAAVDACRDHQAVHSWITAAPHAQILCVGEGQPCRC